MDETLGMLGLSPSDMPPTPDSAAPPDATPVLRNAATGILPHQTLQAMVRAREITAVPEIEPAQLQPASIDLRLGPVAYRVRTSFLPGPDATVMDKIDQLDGYPIEIADGAVLERGCVYVVKLLESVDLPSGVSGFANPKSSIGRLDILTRLITDRSAGFDRIDAGYTGPLYVEIAPRTFSAVVRQGSKLNQLRFRRGARRLAAAELQRLHDQGMLIIAENRRPALREQLVGVTIDLRGDGPDSLIGYRARKHTDRIDVDRPNAYDARDFWEPIHFRRHPSIILDPNDFYILVTREAVRVPPNLAAEMVAYDTTVGEFRVHYAGFFDPGFGWDTSRGVSKAVLEVRSHEVPFLLEHGQTVGWLRYEPMIQEPTKLYGPSIGSNYQSQGLALAKHFRVDPAWFRS